MRLWKRSERKARNNLGVIVIPVERDSQKFRNKKLELLDSYYENRQYDKLAPWDQECGPDEQPIPVRNKKPRIRVALAKTLAQRVTAKLVGPEAFPAFNLEESPDDQELVRAVVRAARLQEFMLEPIRRVVNTGSIFVRFYLSGGAIKKEWYHAKYCYPVFQENGEQLESVRIQYVYDDENDKDQFGKPKKKWFRLDLGMFSETSYDNPEYEDNKEPQFTEVDTVEHGFGFVQGEWFRTCEMPDGPDGYGLCEDLTEFIDELCYSLSQSSQAVSYNQDPQLTLRGMNEDEVDLLHRSSSKSWLLGREGEADFLESDLSGVKTAIEMRDKVRLLVQDVVRVLLLDPEKIVGNAQSAKAMEVLHGPMKDLIDELRGPIGASLKNLVLKIVLAVLLASKRGMEVPLNIPPTYKPLSLDFDIEWRPMFQQTIEDLQKKVSVAISATSGNVISRETALRWLAKDFDVDDIEAELERINSQPVLNPFGGF